MTGRGRGFCNAGIISGVDFGRGMGFGRGFRGGSGAEMGGYMRRGLARNRAVFQDDYPQDAHVEIDRLKMQAKSMKRTLDTINQRLSEMGKSE
jgi:hypothetical protein